jgi:lipoprotein-anchoring transpeptidase ErfK/SrfK
MEFKDVTKKKHWYASFWADFVFIVAGVLALLLIFGTQYATGQFGFSAALEAVQIKPNESITVDFSQPVVAAAVEKNFKISPGVAVGFAWANDFTKVEIKPTSKFETGQTYEIELDPQTSFSWSRIFEKQKEPQRLTFQTESAPKVVSIDPVSGDPSVKIDSGIKISFNESTLGYDVNFVIDPFSNFDLSYGAERKDFTLLPKGKLDYERDYVISVRLAPTDENLSVAGMPEVFRANFKTEPSPPPPDIVDEVVLPEDKLAGIVPSSKVATPDPQITEGKYIDINLAKQQLSIFQDGERLGTYMVSTGKRGMATPTGTFHVMAKSGRAWSRKYNLYMPYWMQFTGAGHGIHELPEWKNGYKEGANHLGTPVSHGCVRLGVGPAAKVYGWADIGTPIVIHY